MDIALEELLNWVSTPVFYDLRCWQSDDGKRLGIGSRRLKEVIAESKKAEPVGTTFEEMSTEVKRVNGINTRPLELLLEKGWSEDDIISFMKEREKDCLASWERQLWKEIAPDTLNTDIGIKGGLYYRAAVEMALPNNDLSTIDPLEYWELSPRVDNAPSVGLRRLVSLCRRVYNRYALHPRRWGKEPLPEPEYVETLFKRADEMEAFEKLNPKNKVEKAGKKAKPKKDSNPGGIPAQVRQRASRVKVPVPVEGGTIRLEPRHKDLIKDMVGALSGSDLKDESHCYDKYNDLIVRKAWITFEDDSLFMDGKDVDCDLTDPHCQGMRVNIYSGSFSLLFDFFYEEFGFSKKCIILTFQGAIPWDIDTETADTGDLNDKDTVTELTSSSTSEKDGSDNPVVSGQMSLL